LQPTFSYKKSGAEITKFTFLFHRNIATILQSGLPFSPIGIIYFYTIFLKL